MRYLLALGTAILFIGCFFQPERIEEEKIDNVVRVFWHEGNNFSVMVKPSGTNRLKLIRFPEYHCDTDAPGVRIFTDVESDKPMWVSSKVGFGGSVKWCVYFVDIHIHSEKDVDGGGWNHGKFGSGQTSVIQ